MPEAFETPGVCSNYHQDYVKKTFPSIQNFKEGNALFTFPNTPIKCAGAPQKIMYITDYHFRQVSFTNYQMSWGLLKFRYFEKATKFETSFLLFFDATKYRVG